MFKKFEVSHRGRLIKDNATGYGFLSPAILLLLFIFGYQIVSLFMFSLVKWNGIQPTQEFNNFSYFVTLFNKGLLYGPLLRSLAITAVVIPVVILLTTFIAHNIYRKVFGWMFYRWIIFITSIIPVIVASIVWTFLLNAYGPINNF